MNKVLSSFGLIVLSIVIVQMAIATDDDLPSKSSGKQSLDVNETMPAEVQKTEEIVKAAQKYHRQSGFLGEPRISTAHFTAQENQIFVAWHNPYSGEAACRVYLYAFDSAKAVWNRKTSKEFPGTHTISIEFNTEKQVRLKDVNGKEIHRYSIYQ